MTQVLFVALGGAFGAVMRYSVGLAAARMFGLGFPWGTLAANVLGGFLMGALTARIGPEHESIRLLIGVGALGGFTTFSTFSLESLRMLQHQPGMGVVYVGASVLLSIAACALGLLTGRPS